MAAEEREPPAPSRADIAPEEMTDILPRVFLMEKIGARLRYRLVGDSFREIHGSKLIGLYLDEIDLDHIAAAYIGEYEKSA
ncbi:MAG TPA: PAS domain-containing protein [Aliidongia sp.]|nr:PAS domain-containing protein [Aliidongia sp.]